MGDEGSRADGVVAETDEPSAHGATPLAESAGGSRSSRGVQDKAAESAGGTAPVAESAGGSNEVQDDAADVLPATHTFSAKFEERVLLFHVMLLEGSLFIWVAGPRMGLDDLQAAIPTRYDSLPSVATLRGESDGPGSSIAQKLSRAFKRLVFMSFNVEDA